MENKINNLVNLDSKTIAELRESSLTVSEFIKRYGMKGGSK